MCIKILSKNETFKYNNYLGENIGCMIGCDIELTKEHIKALQEGKALIYNDFEMSHVITLKDDD